MTMRGRGKLATMGVNLGQMWTDVGARLTDRHYELAFDYSGEAQ